MNLEPMPGKIVVKPDSSDKQVGGIWLIRNARQTLGQIMAIYQEFSDPDTGSDVEPFLKVGDWVIFGNHSGVEVTINRDKYIVMNEREVLCRIKDPEQVEKPTMEVV